MKQTFDLDGLTVTATLSPDRFGRLVVTEIHISGRPISVDEFRRISISRIEASANASAEQRPPFTGRIPGEQPEVFSARVAQAYRLAAATSPHPAADMAREAAVPLPTLHTWVREARLRGLLPPAQRRKAR